MKPRNPVDAVVIRPVRLALPAPAGTSPNAISATSTSLSSPVVSYESPAPPAGPEPDEAAEAACPDPPEPVEPPAPDAPAPDAPAAPIVPDLSPNLTPEQEREMVTAAEMLTSDIRQKILLILAAAGTGREVAQRRVNVSEIARRTGIDPKKASSHLGHLRTAGLVYDYRVGQCREYEAAPGRIHYHHDPATGYFRLTIRARGGGVRVTLEVGNAKPEGLATDGARMNTE